MKVWPRRVRLDLVAQLADEHVHGAVAAGLAPAPDPLQQLVARDDAAALQRERVEEAELGRRQLDALPVDVGLDVQGIDEQLLGLDRLAALVALRPHAPPGRRAHAGDQLLHGERLHEVVVGADLERVDAVVLGAARTHDDDRRADPLLARRLEQPPAVEAGEHQVEHAHVGMLVAQPREARLALVHPDRVEAAATRWRDIPSAMTSSSSMMRTFGTPADCDCPEAIRGCVPGERAVKKW